MLYRSRSTPLPHVTIVTDVGIDPTDELLAMDADFGQQYARMYREHWWFRTRERMLLRQIDSFELPGTADILDGGCGDGLFMPCLKRHGEVCGIEIDASLITSDNPFRSRITHEPLGDARYDGMQFDLITALDVIEHIQDDQHAVAAMHNMLRPGGYMLITVPALNLLWDEHDEINHHFRRYTKRSLRELVEPFGDIVKLNYFFGALFLPKLAVKIANRFRSSKIEQHSLPSNFVNATMQKFFDIESRFATLLPFGTSLLAIVRKPADTSYEFPTRTETHAKQAA